MEPKVELQGVAKVFTLNARTGDTPHTSTPTTKVALADINLTLTQGERIGIIGPNGAGKSSLLHIIAGLSSATSGFVRVTGHVTSILTLGVGLRDDLTGRENIYIDAEIHNRSRQQVDEVIDEIIAFSELGEFIEYPVRTYSTGMKARLAFSMISQVDPEVLIIDEALSVGDASFSGKATARIKDICARGKIVIVVSHSMDSVKSICNRCIWLDHGKVVLDGAPEEVTAAYIDSVRKNDDAQLMQRFRKFAGKHSFAPGHSVNRVELLGGPQLEPRTLLETQQPCAIRVHANAAALDEGLKLRVCITRFDGAVMFEESFNAAFCQAGEQELALEVTMPALMLGAAIYRLDVHLARDAVQLAQDSQVFEVFSAKVPAGGKPMLYSSAFSTVIRLTEHAI
jgi:lipopolysaccharide transport system ATP-binding protein